MPIAFYFNSLLYNRRILPFVFFSSHFDHIFRGCMMGNATW